MQLRAELGRLHQRLGVTTVHVTHDQVEAMTLGNRVAVFSRGTLQQYDTPHRLYDAPKNVFVAGFIGSPAMNFLEATCRATDRPVRDRCGEGRNSRSGGAPARPAACCSASAPSTSRGGRRTMHGGGLTAPST